MTDDTNYEQYCFPKPLTRDELETVKPLFKTKGDFGYWWGHTWVVPENATDPSYMAVRNGLRLAEWHLHLLMKKYK